MRIVCSSEDNGAAALAEWQALQKKLPQAKRYRRFSVLVPAHNEAMVIAPLLESLANQNYPKNCYKVYASCDNCTDNTAEIAREHGIAETTVKIHVQHVLRKLNVSSRVHAAVMRAWAAGSGWGS